MPFWPQNITDKHSLPDKLFVIRITGTLDASTPLPYYKSRSDLIRLRNKVITSRFKYTCLKKKKKFECFKYKYNN